MRKTTGIFRTDEISVLHKGQTGIFTKQTVVGASLVLIITLVVNKILGLAREIIIAQKFGATKLVDAFYVASYICQQAPLMFGGALAITLVPIFIEYRRTRSHDEAWLVASSVLNVAVLSLALLIAVVFFFAPFIARIVAPGFEAEAHLLTVNLIRSMSIIALFVCLIEICTVLFEAYKHFVLPAFTPLITNIVIISSLCLFASRIGIYSLSAGSVMGLFLSMVILLIVLMKKTKRYRFVFKLGHPGVSKVLILAGPVMIGQFSGLLAVWVDQIFASRLGPGNLAAIGYASMGYEFLPSILVLALEKAFFPELNELVVKKDMEGIKDLFHKVIDTVIFVSLPFSLFLMVMNVPLVRLVFERGEFDSLATGLTSGALKFYALGIFSLSINGILSLTFFAFQNTKTPVKIGFGSVGLNVILNLILVRYFALRGLALATSLSAMATTGCLLWLLNKHHFKLGLGGLAMRSLRSGLASLLAITYIYFISRYLLQYFDSTSAHHLAVYLFICLSSGVIIYCLWAIVFNLDTPKMLWGIIRERLGEKR